MANCINLVPKKTTADLGLFLKFGGMTLRYTAKMDDDDDESNGTLKS